MNSSGLAEGEEGDFGRAVEADPADASEAAVDVELGVADVKESGVPGAVVGREEAGGEERDLDVVAVGVAGHDDVDGEVAEFASPFGIVHQGDGGLIMRDAVEGAMGMEVVAGEVAKTCEPESLGAKRDGAGLIAQDGDAVGMEMADKPVGEIVAPIEVGDGKAIVVVAEAGETAQSGI